MAEFGIVDNTNKKVYSGDLLLLVDYMKELDRLTVSEELYLANGELQIASKNDYRICILTQEDGQWAIDFSVYGDPL